MQKYEVKFNGKTTIVNAQTESAHEAIKAVLGDEPYALMPSPTSGAFGFQLMSDKMKCGIVRAVGCAKR